MILKTPGKQNIVSSMRKKYFRQEDFGEMKNYFDQNECKCLRIVGPQTVSGKCCAIQTANALSQLERDEISEDFLYLHVMIVDEMHRNW